MVQAFDHGVRPDLTILILSLALEGRPYCLPRDAC